MATASKKKPAAKKVAKATGKKPGAKKVEVKKVAAKKVAAKKPAAKKKSKVNPALLKALTPSALLAAIVGSKPLPRGQIVKKLWDYIKKNGLQDRINKRLINADEKLKAIFGKSVVDMFEMTKLVSKHIE